MIFLSREQLSKTNLRSQVFFWGKKNSSKNIGKILSISGGVLVCRRPSDRRYGI